MKSAVIVFPGSNCERDVAVALRRLSGKAPAMVWHGETALPDADVIVLPGGFSYGDYLRPGAMAAHSPIMSAVRDAAKAGRVVLGICNGFQILTEIGLLPGALLRNAGLLFICRDTHLRVETAAPPFLQNYTKGDVIRLPAAHHDGRYAADAETLKRLEGDGRIVLRYCDAAGTPDTEGANPNGSAHNIAGLLNETGRVFGLMPHPERLSEPAHGGSDGAALFTSLKEALL